MKLLKLVPDHTNIDFMRWRNLALVLSLIATAASIAFTAYRGLNLGVDFVGGQLVRVTFPQPVNVEELRTKVDAMQLGEASIQEFGSAKTVQIRLPKPPGGDAAANVVAGRVKADTELELVIVQITDAPFHRRPDFWVTHLRPRLGTRFIVYTPEELAYEISAGQVSLVVEPVPLVDRAVNAALNELGARQPPQAPGARPAALAPA